MMYEDSELYPNDTNETTYFDTQNYLEGVMESLYESLDINKLEHCLEELCEIYDVKFDPKPIKVCYEREQSTTDVTNIPIREWYISSECLRM